jgi:transposase
MTNENFSEFMKHFIKHAKPSAEHPALLILDNHQSHINLNVINFAKENHVTLLSFPPHCSHKLQPLDVSRGAPDSVLSYPAGTGYCRIVN